MSELRLGGAEVHDLLLDFTLPGYANVELKPNGANIPVSISNLGEYVTLSVKAALVTSVAEQTRAFKTGFSLVFPLEDLHLFSPAELDVLLNGSEESWEVESKPFVFCVNFPGPPSSSLSFLC